jgi:hypothetical protein
MGHVVSRIGFDLERERGWYHHQSPSGKYDKRGNCALHFSASLSICAKKNESSVDRKILATGL